MKYDATTHHTTPRNGNCRSSCLLARPQVFNISAYFCTATQFLYFGKLFSRSGIGFPRGGLRREKPPTQSPLFFLFLYCGLLLLLGMRGAKTKLTSITQCTRALPVRHQLFPLFPRLFLHFLGCLCFC